MNKPQDQELLIPAYIFDLDGVLANNSHRQHFLERSGDTKPSKPAGLRSS